MVQLIQDIKPRKNDSKYISLPFDKAKKLLEDAGYHIPSFRENAKLRMDEGENSYVYKNGNWVREGFLYIPQKGIFLVRDSPIIADSENAVLVHQNDLDYFLTSEQIEGALANSIEIKADNHKPIPTNLFAESDSMNFIFGDIAKDYGYFLRDRGINELLIETDLIKEKSYATQAWFEGISRKSANIDGAYGCLDKSSLTRGVRFVDFEDFKNH